MFSQLGSSGGRSCGYSRTRTPFLDPGNLERDIEARATMGYSLLWLLMWVMVMGFLIQLLSERVGVAMGHHLAQICNERVSHGSFLSWVFAQIEANI